MVSVAFRLFFWSLKVCFIVIILYMVENSIMEIIYIFVFRFAYLWLIFSGGICNFDEVGFGVF